MQEKLAGADLMSAINGKQIVILRLYLVMFAFSLFSSDAYNTPVYILRKSRRTQFRYDPKTSCRHTPGQQDCIFREWDWFTLCNTLLWTLFRHRSFILAPYIIYSYESSNEGLIRVRFWSKLSNAAYSSIWSMCNSSINVRHKCSFNIINLPYLCLWFHNAYTMVRYQTDESIGQSVCWAYISCLQE